MNRRNFLKSLVTGIVGLTINPDITPIFTESVSIGPVGDFTAWIKFSGNFYIFTPSQTCIIDNIQIPEGY